MRQTLRNMARSVRKAIEEESCYRLSAEECDAAIERAIRRRPHVQALTERHRRALARSVKRALRRRGIA